MFTFSRGTTTRSATTLAILLLTGASTLAQSTPAEQYGYSGREADASGLDYYRARYYDPDTGQFLQRDPIGLSGGINDYTYASGNPVMRVDPSGTIDWMNLFLKFGPTFREDQGHQASGYADMSRDDQRNYEAQMAAAGVPVAVVMASLTGIGEVLGVAAVALGGPMYNNAIYLQNAYPNLYRIATAGIGSFGFGATNTLAKGGSFQDAALNGSLSAITGASLGAMGPAVSAQLGIEGLTGFRTLGWALHGLTAPGVAAEIKGLPPPRLNVFEALYTAGLGGLRLSFGPNMAPGLPGVDATTGLLPLDTFAKNTLPWTASLMPQARYALSDYLTGGASVFGAKPSPSNR